MTKVDAIRQAFLVNVQCMHVYIGNILLPTVS